MLKVWNSYLQDVNVTERGRAFRCREHPNCRQSCLVTEVFRKFPGIVRAAPIGGTRHVAVAQIFSFQEILHNTSGNVVDLPVSITRKVAAQKTRIATSGILRSASFFIQGQCRSGTNCPFVHIGKDDRSPSLTGRDGRNTCLAAGKDNHTTDQKLHGDPHSG